MGVHSNRGSHVDRQFLIKTGLLRRRGVISPTETGPRVNLSSWLASRLARAASLVTAVMMPMARIACTPPPKAA